MKKKEAIEEAISRLRVASDDICKNVKSLKVEPIENEAQLTLLILLLGYALGTIDGVADMLEEAK